MQIRTNLLGTEEVMEISEQQIFAFEPGLGGFESLRRYALIAEEDSPLEWLQSLDDPDVSFALLEPFMFRPDYVFELPDRDAEALGMQEPADALVVLRYADWRDLHGAPLPDAAGEEGW